MRYVLIFWALPMGLIWGWYFLSLYDINFGFFFLSRIVHDAVFEVYGQILGIDPDAIPMLLAEACVLDTLLIGAVIAFRRRRELKAWFNRLRERWNGRHATEPEADPVLLAE